MDNVAGIATSSWLRSRCQDNIDYVRSYEDDRRGPDATAELRMTKALDIFKATKLVEFCPHEAAPLHARDEIRLLKYVFPFLDDNAEAKLVKERDCYPIAATSVDAYNDLMAFSHNKMKLPTWYIVAIDVVLIQPSSEFMERVFSPLKSCMDDRQQKRILVAIE